MIIDFHTHVYPPSFRERREELSKVDATFGEIYSNPRSKLATATELVEAMDRDGVAAAVVMGLGWTDQTLAQEANDYLLQSAQEHPGRLIPFCSVNPAWGKDALAEVERCANLGAKGLGELHPDTQALDVTDEKLMAPFMERGLDLGLPVLTHASEPVGHLYTGKGRTTPQKLESFIKAFPQNTIICAHWGGGLPFYALMPEVEEAMANVYFDSAASPFLYRPDVFQRAVDLVGAGKVLLGTDYPLLTHQRLLNQVLENPFSEDVKERILGGNARKLLGL